MKNPKVSVLMITVRPDQAYLQHPEWHVIGKVIEDLNQQTFKDFELVIVDGVRYRNELKTVLDKANFPIKRVQPKENLWTRHKKCCISNYRNTGLSLVRGELVINIDDCCEIPSVYVELFWRAWSERRVCLSATWVPNGDQRIDRNKIMNPEKVYVSPQICTRGTVFGFGSYPLEMALELNGYDEAYDGAMYLEDIDWSTRLADYGLPMHFAYIPGFRLHDQSEHDTDVIDVSRRQVKCCNAAWQTQQVWRTVSRVNELELWSEESLDRLLGPCHYMSTDGKQMCGHWGYKQTCEYVKEEYLDENGRSFAVDRHPLAAKIFEEPPVRDLAKERSENGW